MDCEQQTDEWRQLRCGQVTASRIADVLRKPRRGQKDSTSRKAYLAQIVAERLTGKPQEQQFESFDTRRGLELEPQARIEYELTHNEGSLSTVGFVQHPTIARAGCSPDALIGEVGLCQFKAPRMHVHMDYILAGIVPVEYQAQMLFEMACTGRQWNDFCSFNPSLPDHLQLFVVRLQRNQPQIEEIEAEVIRFNQEADEIMAKLSPDFGEPKGKRK